MASADLDTQRVLSEIRSIEPNLFEQFVSDVWEYLGYSTSITSQSSDRGIDIVATRKFPYNEKILIQAKRYSSNTTVSGPEMQKYGRLSGKEDVDAVLIISTGGFTKQAFQIADEENIKCVDGTTLSQLVIREDIYELVESHLGEEGVQKPDPKRSSEIEEVSRTESNIAVGEGEYLEIEVVGFDREQIDYADRSGNFVEEKNYTVFCLHLTNKTSYEWKFSVSMDLAVTSVDGFSYNNPQEGHTHRSDQFTPWNNDDHKHYLKPNSKTRVVVIYKGWFEPAKIEYTGDLDCHGDEQERDGKERITIQLDKSVRENLRSLPESLPIDEALLTS